MPEKQASLKPCPFCGTSNVKIYNRISDAKGLEGFAVGCLGYRCGLGPVRNSKEKAGRAWNRRVNDD